MSAAPHWVPRVFVDYLLVHQTTSVSRPRRFPMRRRRNQNRRWEKTMDGINRGWMATRLHQSGNIETKRFPNDQPKAERGWRIKTENRSGCAAKRVSCSVLNLFVVSGCLSFFLSLSLSFARRVVVDSTSCRLVPVRASFATPVPAPPLPPPCPKSRIVHCHYHRRHAFRHHFANYFYTSSTGRFIVPSLPTQLIPRSFQREPATQRLCISASQAKQPHHALMLGASRLFLLKGYLRLQTFCSRRGNRFHARVSDSNVGNDRERASLTLFPFAQRHREGRWYFLSFARWLLIGSRSKKNCNSKLVFVFYAQSGLSGKVTTLRTRGLWCVDL